MAEITNFEKLKNIFDKYKIKAGNPKYVACFGKTFVDENDREYKLALDASELIVNNNFGIIHGGYLVGIMGATSKGADLAINNSSNKNEYWNIGIPMQIFDKELKHASKINLPSAKDIIDRQRALIEFSDICVVFPSGGFGTLTEALMAFHINQIAEKFGNDKVRPIIFFGGKWKKLMSEIVDNLDMKNQKGGEKFVYFINSLEELNNLLKTIGIK